jgi:MFS superfamily sulfate permease-like transporter
MNFLVFIHLLLNGQCMVNKEERWWVLKDFTAGIVVFFIALPLCLGIAMASNASAFSGILSGIVGGILVGLLSGSHTSVSGPAAGLTAVVAAQILILGSFENFLAALFIAGLLQITLGLIRAGFIAKFFPSSVIKGLLAAVGIILILKQLPYVLGLSDVHIDERYFEQDHDDMFNIGSAIIGILSLVILVISDKISWLKKSPLPVILMVIFAALLNSLFQLLKSPFYIGHAHRIQIPSAQLSTLNFDVLLSLPVMLAGVSIALVASLETLVNLEAVDKIDSRQRVSPPNRELMAQGIGNLVLSLIGGLPLTSVIVRSSVNINAGGRTRLATIVHGVLLLICVLFLAPMLNSIPLSCLAAILIITGMKLASPKLAIQMWREGMHQFLPFIITIVAIVFTDLLTGVLVGFASSLFFILQSNFRRPLRVITEQHLTGEVVRIAFANQVSFLNRAALSGIFENVPNGSKVLLDASQTDFMDADILDLINDFKDTSGPARNIQVSLLGFKKTYKLADFIQYDVHATKEIQERATPEDVIKMLKDGNLRVRQGRRLERDLNRQINATSTSQYPLAVVLSCIDSRASVELIFDLGIGDAFSVRIAGNIVSEKVLGSLEFACAVAGAKLIVVMGHTRCGAIGAAVESIRQKTSITEHTGCSHLQAIVNEIQLVADKNTMNPIPPIDSPAREIYEERVIRQNVQRCIENIKEQSACLRKLIDSNKVGITGCIYDVSSGEVEFPQ